MLCDRAKIRLKAGDGGNGALSFRREKYVPEGGPDGGDGGRGGSIYFIADHNLHTLLDFKLQQHYKAKNGSNGAGGKKTGAAGEDLYLRVPQGTIIRLEDNEAIFADLVEDSQKVMVAKGGRGGRGNTRFASNKDKAPAYSEKGEPGEEVWVRLELKLLADVGLVGMPNAGKSTFISRVSSAKPKIADYPFTTMTPNLGIVYLDDGVSFCLADVPGLIENASEGAGLGHYFLRHVERTKALIHVVDMSGLEGRDPLEDFAVVTKELEKYKDTLGSKPRIVAANKMDMPDSEENYKRFCAKYGNKYEIYPISAMNKDNLRAVLYKAYDLIQNAPVEEEVVEEEMKVTTFKPRSPFTIKRDEDYDDCFIVEGHEVRKWIAMTDFSNEDAVKRLQRIFKAMGLDEALKKAGAKRGDTIIAYDLEFEYVD